MLDANIAPKNGVTHHPILRCSSCRWRPRGAAREPIFDCFSGLRLIVVGVAVAGSAGPSLLAQVVVQGIASSKLDPGRQGLVLVEELSCAACHAGEASLAARSKKAPRLADVLLRGKRQRDYVDAARPQFGEANVGHLVELFGKVDRLEAAVLPKVANIQESKAAGYEMNFGNEI